MISLNEIRRRALKFSQEHAQDFYEDGEAKTFWDEFFNIFGVSRRRVASFERAVQKSDGSKGYIDLLWKGVLLIEHKSKGKNLDRAYDQAKDYFNGLKERDLPRYVLVCDFQRFHLYDLESNSNVQFSLDELSDKIHHFGFISGYVKRDFGKEDPANIKAAEQIGALHDLLKADGYTGHPLEVLLVRLLFCLFADDTAIFEANIFREYLEIHTEEDGSDLGYHLAMLFDVLNRPVKNRQKALDESITAFPYINGKLFEEVLPPVAFNKQMRDALLNACALDWSKISPAIFGSLFQSVMKSVDRRNLGAHYTRELNILKALRPLFLDQLASELEALSILRGPGKKAKLNGYIEKLASIKILDPACGCGNFLVIAYRELRTLELKALELIHGCDGRAQLDVKLFSKVDVDQCYGIEIEEFPAQIAQVALWLTDHQMNMELSRTFGNYYVRLPLKKSAKITHGNALELDWKSIVDVKTLKYIIGNPPFKGKKEQTSKEKSEVKTVFLLNSQSGLLDYVSCWYKKSAQMMEVNKDIKTAFVSTNSICQGEQVAPLWRDIAQHGVKIAFCHRTFQWSNEARNVAAVHCIILGLTCQTVFQPIIYSYDTPQSEPFASPARQISPYLVDAKTQFVEKRLKPISENVPPIRKGSEATDYGYLILSDKEKDILLGEEPALASMIRPYWGGEELINKISRWCLWLVDASPSIVKKSKGVLKRIECVRKARLASNKSRTKAWAEFPALFTEIRQPDKRYLAIPKVSSESRVYLPMAFLDPIVIASGSMQTISGASMYHFGVLTSAMHMAWMRHVCGRMKSDYQYSNSIVYNNFPWPLSPTKAQLGLIEKSAHHVLSIRNKFHEASLADLYDPQAMPHELYLSHKNLDKAVDAAYGIKKFSSEIDRMKFLFDMYEEVTSKT